MSIETKNDATIKEVANQKAKSNAIKDKLQKLNVEKYAEKSKKNRNIWKPEFLQSLSTSDKTARRKARNDYQIPLSEAIKSKKDNKYTKTATMHELCQALFDFYKIALIDIAKYSSISETSDNYKTVHNAYSIMKAELKF